MMISPAALAKYGKEIGFHPVGTGPFEFVEWKPAEYLKVKKFDGYWKKGYPKGDTLTFRTVTDNNTRAAVVQTGEAQFAFPVPFEQAAVLSKNDKLDVVDHKNSIMARYLSMNTQQQPFDNVKVREAINYAINKEALAKVAFSGYATIVAGVVPTGVDVAHKTGPWRYAIKKAKDVPASIAALHQVGIPVAFNFGPDVDLKALDRHSGYFMQGGMGLPDPAFYTRTDADTVALMGRYRAYVKQILALTGTPAAKLDAESQSVIALETELARNAQSLAGINNPWMPS
ncbi:hypothetical protein G6F57_017150 [Rhizopus arrhizus]|nr:hypothetical protein G6F57_017150 [Rhizopus arrhizus]